MNGQRGQHQDARAGALAAALHGYAAASPGHPGSVKDSGRPGDHYGPGDHCGPGGSLTPRATSTRHAPSTPALLLYAVFLGLLAGACAGAITLV